MCLSAHRIRKCIPLAFLIFVQVYAVMYVLESVAMFVLVTGAMYVLVSAVIYTVRKMDLILRSIQRRPQMQFSMAHRFKLQLLRRYSVKFSKMRNFTLGSP
jgi:hypothetical protein